MEESFRIYFHGDFRIWREGFRRCGWFRGAGFQRRRFARRSALIAHAFTGGQFAGGFDFDVIIAQRQNSRIDKARDRKRIVHGEEGRFVRSMHAFHGCAHDAPGGLADRIFGGLEQLDVRFVH